MNEQVLIAGRYQQGELIGRGGMGDVFLGVDTLSGQPVAIKRLHSYVINDNESILDRFEREGEALRQLNHPNIVKMLAMVREDEQHYLVMEYVGGGSLRALIDREKCLPLRRVLNIALDLADALTRAHRLNIIHRDLKPDNVLLTDSGVPCLTDFGVAHMGDCTRLTQTGAVIGTYAYLSPEACNGMELDERADIWSFGVMLFEMLAGQPPFHENSAPAVLTAILTKPAPDLTRLRDDIPPALAVLIARMLEKDRDQRIDSVRLIGVELEALLRALDAPVQGRSSRFATPSDEHHVPAVMPGAGGQTHGLPLYPGTDTPRTPMQTPNTPLYPPGTPDMMTPPAYYPPRSNWQWITLMVVVVVLSLTAIALAMILGREDKAPVVPAAFNAAAAGNRAAGNDALAEEAPADTIAHVEPVAPGEYMVLVASLEQVSGIEQLAGMRRRDVSRFIVDDLVQSLEVAAPFSRIRIRTYPDELHSREEAEAAAAANGATVVVWGNYSSSEIEVEVQIGVTERFPHLAFSRETLERTANVRLHLVDERSESIAPYVLTALSVLQNADGSAFEAMRVLAIADVLEGGAAAEASGTTVAALMHQAALRQIDAPATALDYLDQALELDPGNALLYAFRATVYLRMQNDQEARHDLETAQRTGPDDWTMPLMLLANTTEDAGDVLAIFDEIVALRPDDWLPIFFRGAVYYQSGQFVKARADLDAAIALSPSANFPYVYAALLALRDGRVPDAAAAMDVILRQFPDPFFMERLLTATFGDATPNPHGVTIEAFSHLALGRYQETIETTRHGLTYFASDPDLYLIQGLAYCVLGSNQAAERAYSQTLARAPDYALAYLLRAEVRLKRAQDDDAESDIGRARQFDPAGRLEPLIEPIRSQKLGCLNFFTDANPLLTDRTQAVGGAQGPDERG